MPFFDFWRSLFRPKPPPVPLDETLWREAKIRFPILGRLPPPDEARLKLMAARFLSEKQFIPLKGLEIRGLMKVAVAAQAVLPVLNLGLEWLSGFSSIFLTPRSYSERRQDWDGTVMNEYDDELSGEVTTFGSLILSWRDVKQAGQLSGYNVVIHEIAHKLDESNLAMDGCPYLAPAMDPAEWRNVFTDAYEDLRRRGSRAPLDPYAGENPAEFFAVACEEFFERPRRLRRHYPEVHRLLGLFFRVESTTGGS